MYLPSQQLRISFSGLIHLGRERKHTHTQKSPHSEQPDTQANRSKHNILCSEWELPHLLAAFTPQKATLPACWAFVREFSHGKICITHQKDSHHQMTSRNTDYQPGDWLGLSWGQCSGVKHTSYQLCLMRYHGHLLFLSAQHPAPLLLMKALPLPFGNSCPSAHSISRTNTWLAKEYWV